MRFGTSIAQGWRLDPVGIDPAEQWATMNSLATLCRVARLQTSARTLA